MARPEGPPQSGGFEQGTNVGKENLGAKSQRERLSKERREYLIVEAVADALGIETVRRALDEVETQQDEKKEEGRLLTVGEAAELGKVSERSVYGWLRDNKLAPAKYQLHRTSNGLQVFRALVDEREYLEFLEGKPGRGRPNRQPM